MILPAVRERLEALLRHAAMEGALAALRSGASHISITGLHDVAKALVAASKQFSGHEPPHGVEWYKQGS